MSEKEEKEIVMINNNKSIETSKIKNPNDIYNFMEENIQYGWIDNQGNRHIDTMKEFRKIYRTMSIEETLEQGLGCCIEQTNLMHYLLDKINIKNKMFCCRIYEPDNYDEIEEEEHMHCFVLYYENDLVYHLEHPNFKKKGIYEHKTESEAIEKITAYYRELSGGKERPTTQFFEVQKGLSFKQFNNYINSLD